ncbi:cytoplasmic protein [Colletotrichum chrysophilum]|uniref:2-oxoadipate dioxygenase/decarboxylase n=1 Tax=Colletotrichum chrysophilum TaxID=1836956 RepID=A0AAD9B0R4_9PEZI|nr:cytoplasmic protein [Colletotrichum chrysophilum]
MDTTTNDGQVSPDEIRAKFSMALSEMYRAEVPQYGTLVNIVSEINRQQNQHASNTQYRLEVERHGAIRLGTPAELQMIRRLFSIMGMHAVGYYDLSVAGLPVHATCFRPLNSHALAHSPFRVFTSLLRLDLINDDELRSCAERVLSDRKIFTPRCMQLIKELEALTSVPKAKADDLIIEALETFRWHKTSTVDVQTYRRLQEAHPLIADVVCFRGPHINHLTPRVLDIEAAQLKMHEHGLQAKDRIEGPPSRQFPILLRQTSFLALEEEIAFSSGSEKGGRHKARFGEIEQRGIALTPKGRRLYDDLYGKFMREQEQGSSKEAALMKTFQDFPDDLHVLRQQQLAYFTYHVIGKPYSRMSHLDDIDALVKSGILGFEPITYEDFLPVSAAGIFHSNLGAGAFRASAVSLEDQEAFEESLGCRVFDSFELYQSMERTSLRDCLGELNGCK